MILLGLGVLTTYVRRCTHQSLKPKPKPIRPYVAWNFGDCTLKSVSADSVTDSEDSSPKGGLEVCVKGILLAKGFVRYCCTLLDRSTPSLELQFFVNPQIPTP